MPKTNSLIIMLRLVAIKIAALNSLHADFVVSFFEYHHGLIDHVEHQYPIHNLQMKEFVVT